MRPSSASILTVRYPSGIGTPAGPQPHAHRLDRRERSDLELVVDIPSRQVVDDDHVMTLRRQVQRGRPAAKAIATENYYAHKHPFIARAPQFRPMARIVVEICPD